MSMTAAAGARDVTRLELLVCFFFFFFFFITLMFILDLSTYESRLGGFETQTYEWRCQARQGREMRAGDNQSRTQIMQNV
jgi:Mycolic acid cyclopropane synthetase